MPLDVVNDLVELTEQVERECPVGKQFGIDGVGEGIVWKHITEDGGMLKFKVKGQKHSVSKVKKLASVDPEKIESVNNFVKYAVTENRLNQGFQEICDNEPDRAKLGQFIRWVSADIAREEKDVLDANNLTMKDVGHRLSSASRDWFFSKEVI